jgi:hypothetical protein
MKKSTLIGLVALGLVGVGAIFVESGSKDVPVVSVKQVVEPVTITDAPKAQTGKIESVEFITDKQYDKIDAAPQVLIQLCLPASCAEDKALLEGLYTHFPGVKFVQMTTVDNPEFNAQLVEQKRELWVSDSWGWRHLVGLFYNGAEAKYPMYIFKGNDRVVAPDNTRASSQVVEFIQMNASYEETDGNAQPATEPAEAK